MTVPTWVGPLIEMAKRAPSLATVVVLGGVVVFLLWVYVSSIIMMYGVEFTAAYARLRRRRPDEMPAAPTPRV